VKNYPELKQTVTLSIDIKGDCSGVLIGQMQPINLQVNGTQKSIDVELDDYFRLSTADTTCYVSYQLLNVTGINPLPNGVISLFGSKLTLNCDNPNP
jgi:hypothetical protein